ncbi:MAG: hypothetical protein RLY20_1533 [Verrucomicrobiota bacterium]
MALAGIGLAADAPVEIKLTKESELADIRRDPTVNAVEKVMPSVVNIATSHLVEYRDPYDELMRQFFGQPRRRGETKEELYSLGSGVIVDENGYILTNWHVIRGATRIQVQLSDGRVYEAERVVYTPNTDVALLRLKAKEGEKFTTIKFAKDDDLLLGETVIALGNPFGYGGSVSRGILSSKNRRPTSGDEKLMPADLLQTDAAINPGNSGGPLVNMRGELIGINTTTEERAQGISFAIPVKQIASVMSEYVVPEFVPGFWFGAKLKSGELPLTVTEVQPGSPAAKAGLKTGMQIAEVDGKAPRTLVNFLELMVGSSNMIANAGPTNNAETARSLVVRRAVGSQDTRSARLVVLDGGTRRVLDIKMEPFGLILSRRAGLVLDQIEPKDAVRLGLQPNQGFLVTAVEKGSPADVAGLKPGLLVSNIEGMQLKDLGDLGRTLISKGPNESLGLLGIAVQQVSANLVQTINWRAELKLRDL